MKSNSAILGLLFSSVAALGVTQCFANRAGDYGDLPLSFEANQGQTDPQVKFLARGPGYSLFLTPSESVMKLTRHSGQNDETISVALRLQLVGSNLAAPVSGVDKLSGRANYFIGNDRTQWHAEVPTYAKVELCDVYRGVDLVYYGHDGQLEYDFIVAPGADPSTIRLTVDGAEKIQVNAAGDLVLAAAGRDVSWHKPVCYQEIAGVRTSIAGRYVLRGNNEVRFAVGAYDRDQPLVIDPSLVYATFIKPTTFVGGDGLQNHGLAIKVDAAGNAYVAGVTESASFPVTGGAFRTARPGNYDAFVAKLNPAGSALVFATYLGGDGNEIQNLESCGITFDKDFNVYVVGATGSTNFPTTVGAYSTALQGSDDAFVTKLNPSGSALIYSTYLGGTGLDYGWGIAVDTNSNAYVCGESNGGFPTTPGAFIPSGVSLPAFVAKLTADGTGLVYSTLLSSNDTTKAHSIAVDVDGNAYVTGYFGDSSGLEGFVTTPGAFQTSHSGSSDAFLLKLNSDGTGLIYSTLLGGVGNEDGRAVAIDTAGNAYVAGITTSTNFPTLNPVQSTFQSTPTPTDDGFVAKLNTNGTALVYSTYLGGHAGDDAYAIAVDTAGNAWVTGGTGSTNFPVTVDALQNSLGTALGAAFVTELDPTGALTYSSFFRSTNANSFTTGYAIATDTNNNVYVTGTSSLGIPTTPGAFQGNTGFIGGPFVAKFGSGSGGGGGATNGVFAFSAASYVTTETNGTAKITVVRTGGSTGSVTVTAATSDGTATAGADYGATTNLLTFATGVTTQMFNIAIIKDSATDPDETVNISLSGATGGATIGSPATAVLTITDIPLKHDLAVVKMKAPKKATLSATVTNVVGKFSVSIQNNSDHSEVIGDVGVLSNLVTLAVHSLSNSCPDITPALVPTKLVFPYTWAPKKKITLAYTANVNCANDSQATTTTGTHNDFDVVATVHHEVLSGSNPDGMPANDTCPHAPFGLDKGCGGKTPPGSDVFIDVIMK